MELIKKITDYEWLVVVVVATKNKRIMTPFNVSAVGQLSLEHLLMHMV